jgi:hypothetical protein
MRHARLWQGGRGLGWAVLGMLAWPGCTHNYYYGAAPACAPAVVPSTVANGAVCAVPGQVQGGTVLAQGAGPATVVNGTPVLGGPRPPRVVVSEPNGGLFRGWRRSDPDSGLATTKVEGALDDSTVNR